MSLSFEFLEPRLRGVQDCFNGDWLHVVGDMTPAEIAKVRQVVLALAAELSAFAGYLDELPPEEKRPRPPWLRG